MNAPAPDPMLRATPSKARMVRPSAPNHADKCDPGCGCRGNAIPPTYVLMQRLEVEALAAVIGRIPGATYLNSHQAARAIRAHVLGANQ